jgi:hypothetical protein
MFKSERDTLRATSAFPAATHVPRAPKAARTRNPAEESRKTACFQKGREKFSLQSFKLNGGLCVRLNEDAGVNLREPSLCVHRLVGASYAFFVLC